MNITPPERDQLIEANRLWRELTLACGREPTACDRAALDRVSAGPAKAGALQGVDQRLAAGEKSVMDPARPTYFVVTEVVVAPDGRTGTVVVCNTNGDVRVRINDPANLADDEIVDSRLISGAVTSYFERIDGVWKVTSIDAGDVYEEVNVCPPAGS